MIKAKNAKKQVKTKKSNVKRVNKVQVAMLGTATRPPDPTQGNQAKILYPPKSSTFRRQFKLQVLIATTGTQTFFNYCFYLYSPMQYTVVTAGTVVPTNAPSTSFTAMLNAIQYYRVKRVLIEYTHSVASTSVVPPIYAGMNPALTPATVGGSATYGDTINSYENSVQIDAHKSCSFGWWVPPVSDVTYSGANNDLQGGWISSAVAKIARTGSDPGVIALSCGFPLFVSPLTTSYGVCDVTWDVEFKLPL